MTLVVRSLEEFVQWRESVDAVAAVLTMGALHEGHASLIKVAKASGLPVVTTLFVNPTQFGPNEDLARYPRTEAEDIALARANDVDCLWIPTQQDIYPAEGVEQKDPGRLGAILEGAIRPTHFAGVLTVVTRFFSVIRPAIAVFGKKDRQQLILIDEMVRGSEPTIVAAETIRDADGLAMSSRNRYLAKDERSTAALLPTALFAAANVAQSGGGVSEVTQCALDALAPLELDYCVLTNDRLDPVGSDYRGPAILLAAIRLGNTRLIDNVDVVIG
jgi:pantoate--beta-alanine ligase